MNRQEFFAIALETQIKKCPEADRFCPFYDGDRTCHYYKKEIDIVLLPFPCKWIVDNKKVKLE